jgi:hypothetical protein
MFTVFLLVRIAIADSPKATAPSFDDAFKDKKTLNGENKLVGEFTAVSKFTNPESIEFHKVKINEILPQTENMIAIRFETKAKSAAFAKPISASCNLITSKETPSENPKGKLWIEPGAQFLSKTTTTVEIKKGTNYYIQKYDVTRGETKVLEVSLVCAGEAPTEATKKALIKELHLVNPKIEFYQRPSEMEDEIHVEAPAAPRTTRGVAGKKEK